MPYIPQPGTIPAKVIEYLRAQPPGFSIATRPLLEQIGQPDLSPLQGYVKPALAAGVITYEREPGAALGLWRLGGVPAPPVEDDEQDDDPAPAPKSAHRAARPPAGKARRDVSRKSSLDDHPSADEIRRFGLGFGVGIAVRLAERALRAEPGAATELLRDACTVLSAAADTIDPGPASASCEAE